MCVLVSLIIPVIIQFVIKNADAFLLIKKDRVKKKEDILHSLQSSYHFNDLDQESLRKQASSVNTSYFFLFSSSITCSQLSLFRKHYLYHPMLSITFRCNSSRSKVLCIFSSESRIMKWTKIYVEYYHVFFSFELSKYFVGNFPLQIFRKTLLWRKCL